MCQSFDGSPFKKQKIYEDKNITSSSEITFCVHEMALHIDQVRFEVT